MSWVGFDLDGTLAKYTSWEGPHSIGEPIGPMVSKLLDYANKGIEVRIVTARAADKENLPFIDAWCEKNLGRKVPVTDKKDFQMSLLYDDRAIQVESNTGRIIGDN